MKKISLSIIVSFLVASGALATPKQDEYYSYKLLNKISFGINESEIKEYQKDKNKFINLQLNYLEDKKSLSTDAFNLIKDINFDIEQNVGKIKELHEKIRITLENDKEPLKKEINELNQKIIQDIIKKKTIRSLYSQNQLQETLDLFWMNHFNVFIYKGAVKDYYNDYEENIRKNMYGNYKNLLFSVIKSPAMLFYLDNWQNVKGKINENFAREFMELHTMGVNGGYTQEDVQELAKIFTGLTIVRDEFQKEKLKSIPGNIVEGDFVFDIRRHDMSDKIFLNHIVKGKGFEEIEEAIDIILNNESASNFITKQLANYYLGENVSQKTLSQLNSVFKKTHGDLKEIMMAIISSDEINTGKRFKDPINYVYSNARLLLDSDKIIINYKMINNAINYLGEPILEKQTPDGWNFSEKEWTSSDQVFKRLQIAKQFSYLNPDLFIEENKIKEMDKNDLNDLREQIRKDKNINNVKIYKVVKPLLSTETDKILEQANNNQEWIMLLLSSPEFSNK